MNNSDESDKYFSIRYRPDTARTIVWREIIRSLQVYIPSDAKVLELGPGYCDFINQLSAKSKVAVDINSQAQEYVQSDIKFVVGDCSNLDFLDPQSIDIVFASNLLEHLEKNQVTKLLRAVFKVLRPGGKLILIQPNFRYSYAEYYDDYTHVTPFTHVGLCGFLESESYKIISCIPRYLPLSMQTAVPKPWWLIRLYLNLPIRPLAKQMLVVAEKTN